MIDEVVSGIIQGCGAEARAWLKLWDEKRGAEKPLKILEGMLRDPRYTFRSTEVLAKAIDDRTEDHEVTRKFLIALGARHNTAKKDSWTLGK